MKRSKTMKFSINKASIILPILVLTIFSVIAACNTYSENGESTAIEPEPGIDYKMVSKDIFGYSSEGGKIQGLYLKDSLTYIKLSLYGEMGMSQREYFFDNDIITVSYLIKRYPEPFSSQYVEAESFSRFLIDDRLYASEHDKGELILLSNDETEKFKSELNEFIALLNNGLIYDNLLPEELVNTIVRHFEAIEDGNEEGFIETLAAEDGSDIYSVPWSMGNNLLYSGGTIELVLRQEKIMFSVNILIRGAYRCELQTA